MAHAYTKDQLVQHPTVGLFAELGWQHRRTHDLLLPRLLSGLVELTHLTDTGLTLDPRRTQGQTVRHKASTAIQDHGRQAVPSIRRNLYGFEFDSLTLDLAGRTRGRMG